MGSSSIPCCPRLRRPHAKASDDKVTGRERLLVPRAVVPYACAGARLPNDPRMVSSYLFGHALWGALIPTLSQGGRVRARLLLAMSGEVA